MERIAVMDPALPTLGMCPSEWREYTTQAQTVKSATGRRTRGQTL